MSARGSYREGAAFGALSFAVMAVLGVASGIVTARIYGVGVIGAFALVMAPVNAVWYLSSARERPALVRELAVLEPRAPRVTGLFAAVLAFSFGLTVAVSAVAVAAAWVVFHGPIDHPELFAPVAVSLVGYALVTNTGWNIDAVFAAFRAGRRLFWIRLHQTVAFLVLAVALGLVLDGVWGLVAATIGSAATALAHRLVSVGAYMRLTAPRRELREGFRTLPDLIRFGLKIVPGSIASGVSNEIGTWTLGVVGSVAAVGAYSRAWTLSRRLVEVNWRVTEMLFPTLVERHSGGDGAGFDRALVDTMRYCAAGLLLPAAAAGGAATGVMALYGPGFGRGATALAVLIAVPAVITVGSVQRHALLAVERPWATSAVALVKMLVTVVATVVLTVWLGVTGTALGLLAGAAAEVVWMGVLTAAHLQTPLRELWPYRQMAALAVAYVAGFAVARGVDSALGPLAGLVPALAAGAVIYVGVLVAAGGVAERDRDRFRALAGRLRRRARPLAAPAR